MNWASNTSPDPRCRATEEEGELDVFPGLAVAQTGMGKPLSKASEGGFFDVLEGMGGYCYK